FGFAGVWMIAVPESRVIMILLAAPMVVSLVAMNYHFVSDVIAGSVLGALIAMYAVHLARLKMACGNAGNCSESRAVQGARLIFHFSIFLRVGVSALIGVAVLWTAPVNGYARDGSKEWIVLRDCRMIPNPANDGDSFHVSVGPN